MSAADGRAPRPRAPRRSAPRACARRSPPRSGQPGSSAARRRADAPRRRRARVAPGRRRRGYGAARRTSLFKSSAPPAHEFMALMTGRPWGHRRGYHCRRYVGRDRNQWANCRRPCARTRRMHRTLTFRLVEGAAVSDLCFRSKAVWRAANISSPANRRAGTAGSRARRCPCRRPQRMPVRRPSSRPPHRERSRPRRSGAQKIPGRIARSAEHDPAPHVAVRKTVRRQRQDQAFPPSFSRSSHASADRVAPA
jgi:hypothetical protein